MSTADPCCHATTPATVDVVLADDSALVRDHLTALLSTLEGVRVVGQAGSTPQLIDLLGTIRPTVVVLDISMPGGNGIKALQHIRTAYPDTIVIMLTNHSNDFYRRRCLEGGAHFFFDKAAEFEKVGDVLADLAGPA